MASSYRGRIYGATNATAVAARAIALRAIPFNAEKAGRWDAAWHKYAGHLWRKAAPGEVEGAGVGKRTLYLPKGGTFPVVVKSLKDK